MLTVVTVLLSVLGAAAEFRKPPVPFEYTALARAYFNAAGQQVGQLLDISERDFLKENIDDVTHEKPVSVIGPVPDKMPGVRDIVQTGEAGSAPEYRIVSVMGKGTDSVVYRGVLHSEGTTPAPVVGESSHGVAIKFQIYDDSNRHFSVETDYAVLSQTAQFGPLFPRVEYLSELGNVMVGLQARNLRFLVMELLGGSVHSLVKNFHGKLPMETVASIGMQSVEILEALHSINLIHGDIHLENMMFRVENADGLMDLNGHIYSSHVVLGDYGKSAYYVDPSTGEHVPEEEIEFSNERNMLFLSPYELAFGSPSRREDIFRLMETLCRMIDSETYTQYFRRLADNREAILHAKQTVPLGEVLRGIDPVFSSLYDYSRSMSFTETPEYEKLKAGFRTLIESRNLSYGGAVILPTH